VETFTLVGAFGSQLDCEAARMVGLFSPELPEPKPLDREYIVGQYMFPTTIDLGMLNNAALIGTVLAALGESPCLAGSVTHVEMADNQDYTTALLGALDFG
jgi:hypothetical protein